MPFLLFVLQIQKAGCLKNEKISKGEKNKKTWPSWATTAQLSHGRSTPARSTLLPPQYGHREHLSTSMAMAMSPFTSPPLLAPTLPSSILIGPHPEKP